LSRLVLPKIVLLGIPFLLVAQNDAFARRQPKGDVSGQVPGHGHSSGATLARDLSW